MITDTGYWMSITNYASFIAVFPDRCVEGLEPVESHLIIDTEEETSADLRISSETKCPGISSALMNPVK